MVVFVQDTAEAVASPDIELRDLIRIGEQRGQRV
jgi:hypothetical protein